MISCNSYSNGTCLKFATECVLESDLVYGCADIDPMDKEKKSKTNYDRLVGKTPEELAEWIAGGVLNLTGGSLKMATEAWFDWLRKECE